MHKWCSTHCAQGSLSAQGSISFLNICNSIIIILCLILYMSMTVDYKMPWQLITKCQHYHNFCKWGEKIWDSERTSCQCKVFGQKPPTINCHWSEYHTFKWYPWTGKWEDVHYSQINWSKTRQVVKAKPGQSSMDLRKYVFISSLFICQAIFWVHVGHPHGPCLGR